ncbi:NAD-dependent epimerase/dehydratase family protein [Litorimonas sp. WD9-15]|uniref:NAD-dependent epimerase/dehydratase family protein n=1 Tax=Litorimonas sp. WD9-15 TaxID=3418716 RepID=UPI003D092924
MDILLTGAAGFIGFHAARRLLAEGHRVIGVDNLNSYYDTALKQARLAELKKLDGFTFHELDLADQGALETTLKGETITHILHLAAQAGVRYSLEDPHSYVRSNVMGHLNVLEYARHAGTVEHVAYASSSSVYGEREPGDGFKETDRVREPASLYAATKLSGEMISESYARLYDIPQTGLRFFTVYGPWGRPDMAYWIFTQKILAGDPITLFAPEMMQRDFTFVNDIVNVLPKIIATPPDGHVIYNLGNSAPNRLMDLVSAVETACERKAVTDIQPQQAGDVRATFADISAAQRDFGFAPKIDLHDGLKRFVTWYRDWIK